MDTAIRVQNPELDCWHLTAILPLRNYSLSNYGQILGNTGFFYLGMTNSQGEGKL